MSVNKKLRKKTPFNRVYKKFTKYFHLILTTIEAPFSPTDPRGPGGPCAPAKPIRILKCS